MSGKTTPVILNLAGEFSQELTQYFNERKLTLITDPKESAYTHILTRDITDFSSLASEHNTVEQDIRIISLTRTTEMENFVSANGKLVVDTEWVSSPLGFFILDKFFQEYSGVSISDNYPTFTELGSFNVVNPFSTGEYLDRLVFEAFNAGVPALSIKTYFDHLLIFLTHLKANKKVSFPVEVSYGSFGEVFGLQLHFFAENFGQADVQEALSTDITLNSEAHSLEIAMKSSSFLDFTFLQDVKKAVITGLWPKSSTIGRNSGFFISSLNKASSLDHFPGEGLSPFFVKPSTLGDMTFALSPDDSVHETVIAGGRDEAEAVSVIKGQKAEKEETQRISGSKEKAESNTVVKGSKEDKPEVKTLLKSSKEDKPEVITVLKSSKDDKPEAKTVLKSSKEEKTVLQRVSGSQDTDAGDMKVMSLGSNSSQAEQQHHETVQSFQEQLGRSQKENELLKGKLLTLGNELRTIRESQKKINAINSNLLKASEDAPDVPGEETPEQQLKKLQIEVQQKDALFQQELEKLQRQNLNKDSVLTRLKENMMIALNKKDLQIDNLQTRLNEQNLSKTSAKKDSGMDLGEMQFNDFGGKPSQIQSKSLEVDSNLLKSNRENELLKEKLVTMGQELQQLRDQHSRSTKLLVGEDVVQQAQDKNERDVIFTQAADKLERENAVKDLMLDKNREAFSRALERKDEEIQSLKERNSHLSQENANKSQAQQVVHLERQVQNLTKMNESYKNRVSVLTSELDFIKNSDSQEDPKRLQMIINQNKNIIESLKKDLAKIQERSSTDSGTILSLKNEKSKLEQELKKLTITTKVDKVSGNQDQELKKLNMQNQMLENQVRESLARIKELEGKLQESLRSQKNQAHVEDNQSKAKITQLEGSVKKLTSDLVDHRNQLSESKKELNKLRLEKTAIQNQADKYKKEAEKAKAAMPKKAGPGGKAA